MKVIIGVTGAILLLGGLVLITGKDSSGGSGSGNGNGSVQSASTAPNSQNRTFDTIKSDVANGGQLIDVRTAEEYAVGHIDGAVNLPLQTIQEGIMPTSAKDQTVYVYCRSGNRSAQATTFLKAAGYQKVVDLGAMTAVQKIGGTIATQ